MDTYARGALTFDVLDRGPADGAVVLLLHGFPQSAHSWDQVVPALHEAGLRTLAPAQRGYSPGARPPGRAAYALDELVADALAALDAAGTERAHVVGHDWGAIVGWALAGAHPDRVASLTALSVPHTGAYLRSLRRGPQLLRSWYVAGLQLPALPERLLAPSTARGRARFVRMLTDSGLPRAAAERDAAALAEPGAFAAAIGWYRALPMADRALGRRAVTVPTTYVWGDGDRFITRAAAEACGRFVTAAYRFEVLRGIDHWIPDSAAELVSPLILERIRAA